MSKYGSAISMKDMMKQEYEMIDSILDLYGVSGDSRRAVTDAYKNICYHWCQTNAFACLTEEVLTQMLDVEHRVKMQKLILKLSLGYVTQKMDETFPWYDDDPLDDGEDEEEVDCDDDY